MKIAPEIKNINDSLNLIVTKIVDRTIKDLYSKNFNTKDLPDHEGFLVHPNTYQPLRYLFKELDLKKSHCLYWFELDTIDKAKELNSLIDKHRLNKGKPDYRVVPATNKNNDSKVLYVGIRRGHKNKRGVTNIVGRINQHLGYYHVNTTQGLQLCHYAQGLEFEITLNVVEFEDLENPMYLNLLEKMVADRLKPLCGRH